jgi:hypothetical protein
MVVETACLHRLEEAMRHSRLKPDYQDSWHHCYNRAVGTTADRPFAEALLNVPRPALPVRFHDLDPAALQAELRREFARLAAEENRQPPTEVEKAMAEALPPPDFTLSAHRRVRHWVDGLVIGSELFVRDTLRRATRSGSAAPIRRHRLARSVSAPEVPVLCCRRRLRVMRN